MGAGGRAGGTREPENQRRGPSFTHPDSIGMVPPALALALAAGALAAAAFLAFLAGLAAGAAAAAAGLRLAAAFFFGAAPQALVNAASSQTSMPLALAVVPLAPAPGPATRRSAAMGPGGGTSHRGRAGR